ncbi:unnamed protein product [Nezara viridula]|uniref:Neuropeptide n=1 Tax=Nezara viridula TaxID=85310 RepID=A0A9P0H825_NEZVI|nr:unnamed protein product [Nezara viridula]
MKSIVLVGVLFTLATVYVYADQSSRNGTRHNLKAMWQGFELKNCNPTMCCPYMFSCCETVFCCKGPGLPIMHQVPCKNPMGLM